MQSLQDPFHEAASLLAGRGRRGLPFEPRFTALDPPRRAVPATAVDGSHAVLVDAGAVWVVAVRAAAASWPGSPQPERPPRIHAALACEAPDAVAAEAEPLGLPGPERVASAEDFAARLRALVEVQAALEVLDALPRGGLLLVDGALDGVPEDAARMVALLRARARRRAVHVVGVAKRSGLSVGGVPLLPALDRAGRQRLPGRAWCTPVPDTDGSWVARLHPGAPFPVRVDGADPDALAALLPLCRDAVYTGYPYPLAAAHNAACITRDHRDRLLHRLGDAVAAAGGPQARALLQDPHALLDRNVPG